MITIFFKSDVIETGSSPSSGRRMSFHTQVGPVATDSLNSCVQRSNQQVHKSMKLIILLPHDGKATETPHLKKLITTDNVQRTIISLWQCCAYHYCNEILTSSKW